ncbi:MAG: hypothetical protein N2053_11955 [Chitinispirillaceae bacterium]|nr:hypothetical protein [Chitinispirillaceae bacterium]
MSILLVIVTLFRFNRHDIWILNKITGGENFSFVAENGKIYKKLSLDSYNYLLFVRFFRTVNTSRLKQQNLPIPPFSYRPLGPFVASFLPFDEMTSLNIINLLALIITLFFLKLILIKTGVSLLSQVLALLMFIISFPVFYYGTIGYIDPLLIMFLAIGLFMIITEKWFLYALSIFMGTFAKEGMAILLPLPFVVYFLSKRKSFIFLVGIMGIILYLVATYFTRSIISSPVKYFWIPSPKAFLSNLSRFRTYFSVLASVGLPGLLGILAIFSRIIKKDTYFYLLKIGVIFSFFFFLLGMSSVYTDGRYIWPAYIFFIPLSALYLDYCILISNKGKY